MKHSFLIDITMLALTFAPLAMLAFIGLFHEERGAK